MNAFPVLRTGAVIQYPAQRSTLYSTSVVRFVDGSEQRARDAGKSLRKWTIRLDQLDEGELAAVDAFFAVNHGAAGDFTFTDPWDGTVYPSCSLQQDEAKLTWNAPGDGSAQLVIQENRS